MEISQTDPKRKPYDPIILTLAMIMNNNNYLNHHIKKLLWQN